MVRKLWMTGESIVTTLELWACLFCEVKVCMRGLFIQEHVAAAPNLFLDGLLGDERRKGTKSARFHDWAHCELADLDVDEYDAAQLGLLTRSLLIRRNISEGDLAFSTTR